MEGIVYSFIIPHRNTPQLLNRCIDSIPSRGDIEIIIIDDNSEEGKKPSITREGVITIYLDNTQSNGAGHARNEGLKIARGKWVLFADSDDYYTPGFISVLDKYVGSDIDVLYFNFSYKDGLNGEELYPLSFNHYFEGYDGTPYSIDSIKFHHNVPWTKMCSRFFLNKNSIRFEESINGNDIFFSMAVGYFAKRIEVEKTPIYVYLRNPGSIINKKKLSVPAGLCYITHRIKQNEFYSFIGHPEWRHSVFKVFFSLIHRVGLPFVFFCCFNWRSIFGAKLEWVIMLTNKLN